MVPLRDSLEKGTGGALRCEWNSKSCTRTRLSSLALKSRRRTRYSISYFWIGFVKNEALYA